jgi:hypothetical protein
VRAVAVGAQAVQRRDAHGGREVGVAAAARHGRVFQQEAGAFGIALHQRQQIGGGFGLHHGRTVQLHIDVQFHVRTHGAQLAHAAQHVFGGAHVGHAEVDHAAAQRWHGVGHGAAGDGADAHGDAAVIVGHGFQRQHLVGHFADGAAALLMLHAGMGRTSLDVQVQHAGALARRDALAAVGAGGFADQRVLGVGGKALDVRARRVAAGFFVGHHQKVHRQLGRAGARQAGQRRQRQVDAGLHVVAARPIEAVAFDAHRVLQQRAHRMHRVHVRQDQDAGARVAGGAVGRVQQRTRGRAQGR